MKRERYRRNPFKNVQFITPIPLIIDYAFAKVNKHKPRAIRKEMSREEKIATIEHQRIEILAEQMTQKLDIIVKQFPSIDNLHKFYVELCDLIADIDRVKNILGRIDGISKQIKKIELELTKQIFETTNPKKMAKIRREAGGRFVSLLKKIGSDVEYLIYIIKKLKEVPDFDISVPTVVIAGAPNVGKSSLINIISSGTPEIGEYPFTTKKVIFGHRKLLFGNAQIVDTPGLLDRPFSERNLIEKKSIATIRHIADIIVFIFDFSKDATLSKEEQLSLLGDIQNEYPEVPTIKTLNKTDILKRKDIDCVIEKYDIKYAFSTKNRDGIKVFTKDLDALIINILKIKEKFEEYRKLQIAEEFKEEINEENKYGY